MLYTTVDYDPIKVRVREDGDFDLIDGRHRWVAALGAGRQDILAELE
jgi:ParB-like chromosome segregation protein Spo0J